MQSYVAQYGKATLSVSSAAADVSPRAYVPGTGTSKYDE